MSRSDYYLSLSGDIKCRYDEKIQIIDNIDPYTLSTKELSLHPSELPNLVMMDLVNYLILSHSFYTGAQLKAYKSLQSYKYYESGAVLEMLAKQINDNAYAVLIKVRHSQKFREKPLETWIIILKDGSISSAHCTCMAGLSEVCTHVATALFYLHARPTTVDDSQACTSKLASWPVPPLRNVDMVRVKDMDWARNLTTVPAKQSAPCMTEQERGDLLRKLQEVGVQPAICRIIEPFASEMASSGIQQELPQSLDSLYQVELTGKTYEELLKIASNITVQITDEQINVIEYKTREQSQNNMWFKYRAGRITASRFKSVCRTSIEKPSLTVIKGVCYPQKVISFSKATAYGIRNEKQALKCYGANASARHISFSLRPCGLFISKDYPELGASPDGLICCDCCGLGCVEVKCPYILDNDEISLEEFAQQKNTCLFLYNDQVKLDKSHCYYYQIQLQLFVTKRQYCDFVIWSKNYLYIERIMFDNSFCLENVEKTMNFHNLIIKPELLGRFFTEKGGFGKVGLWCFCNKPDDGRPMLKCDNDNCELQWFHFSCVNILEVPSTNWFCPSCA